MTALMARQFSARTVTPSVVSAFELLKLEEKVVHNRVKNKCIVRIECLKKTMLLVDRYCATLLSMRNLINLMRNTHVP